MWKANEIYIQNKTNVREIGQYEGIYCNVPFYFNHLEYVPFLYTRAHYFVNIENAYSLPLPLYMYFNKENAFHYVCMRAMDRM